MCLFAHHPQILGYKFHVSSSIFTCQSLPRLPGRLLNPVLSSLFSVGRRTTPLRCANHHNLNGNTRITKIEQIWAALWKAIQQGKDEILRVASRAVMTTRTPFEPAGVSTSTEHVPGPADWPTILHLQAPILWRACASFGSTRRISESG